MLKTGGAKVSLVTLVIDEGGHSVLIFLFFFKVELPDFSKHVALEVLRLAGGMNNAGTGPPTTYTGEFRHP